MAPIGSYESLMAAINAGADSVYFGIEGLNMRSKSANNFTTEDLYRIAAICREHGVKSYLTVNTIIYDEDLELMRRIIDAAKDAEVSSIIAADVAPMLYARSIGVEVHLSTQLNITNVEALRFYAQFADVVVLARELNMDQVAAIHRAILEEPILGPGGQPIRIEMFAHGALCMAVSGKCYLSLAKTYAMTGWRVGWMIGPSDVIKAALSFQSHLTSNVNNVAQEAARSAVSGSLDAVDEMRVAFDRRRRLIVDMLRQIDGFDVPTPKGAFYVYPSVERLLGREIRGRVANTSGELADLILDEVEVAAVPGEAFGPSGFLRFSYALSDDDLVEGITRVQELFA